MTDEQAKYLEYVAWEAAKGIVGPEAAEPRGELVDGILLGLVGITDAAYQRGVDASVVQLSLDPGMARVVG